MKLRFEVDQAAAFRRGLDCPKSIVSIDVDPSSLPAEQRNLLADRMQGIDILKLFYSDGEVLKGHPLKELFATTIEPRRIVAEAPSFEGMMAAVRQNEHDIQMCKTAHRRPIQFRLLTEPPPNHDQFFFISSSSPDWMKEFDIWTNQGNRVVFDAFLDEVQKQLNEKLNAKGYRVFLLPIPGLSAQARFYCERWFGAKFLEKPVSAHSPIIVYNEKTGRVVEVNDLFQALDVYLVSGTFQPGVNINDLNILRWDEGRWVIVAPEPLIDAANKRKKAA